MIVLVPLLIVKMGRRFKGIKACLLPLLQVHCWLSLLYYFTENPRYRDYYFPYGLRYYFVASGTAPFIILAAVGAALIAAGVYVLWKYASSGTSFRISRILVWQNPEKYADGDGYQILQALYALGSGGLFGKKVSETARRSWVPSGGAE